MAAALGVQDPRIAGVRIDPLNIAATVILGRTGGQKPALGIFVAPIVADIERAVRATATPFGPPPASPIADSEPPGAMRVSAPPAISPKMTEPSAIATGPSGNRKPVAMTRMSGIARSSR